MNDNVGTDAEADALDFGAPDGDEAYYESTVAAVLEGRKDAYKNGPYGREASLLPNSVESDRLKARTFSFKQLYEFNNLVLNKSFLKKRTKVNEDHIAKLQAEMLEQQRWREDIEKRMAQQFQDRDDRLNKNDEELVEYK